MRYYENDCGKVRFGFPRNFRLLSLKGCKSGESYQTHCGPRKNHRPTASASLIISLAILANMLPRVLASTCLFTHLDVQTQTKGSNLQLVCHTPDLGMDVHSSFIYTSVDGKKLCASLPWSLRTTFDGEGGRQRQLCLGRAQWPSSFGSDRQVRHSSDFGLGCWQSGPQWRFSNLAEKGHGMSWGSRT